MFVAFGPPDHTSPIFFLFALSSLFASPDDPGRLLELPERHVADVDGNVDAHLLQIQPVHRAADQVAEREDSGVRCYPARKTKRAKRTSKFLRSHPFLPSRKPAGTLTSLSVVSSCMLMYSSSLSWSWREQSLLCLAEEREKNLLVREFVYLVCDDDGDGSGLLRLDDLADEAALAPLHQDDLAGDVVGVEERAAAAGGVGRDQGHVVPGVVLEKYDRA